MPPPPQAEVGAWSMMIDVPPQASTSAYRSGDRLAHGRRRVNLGQYTYRYANLNFFFSSYPFRQHLSQTHARIKCQFPRPEVLTKFIILTDR